MLLVRRIVAKFASSQAEERGRKVGRCCWLRGQVTPPFAERRQTKRDQSRLAPGDACALMRTESSPTSRPERNQSNKISSTGRFAKASASAVNASLSGSATRQRSTLSLRHGGAFYGEEGRLAGGWSAQRLLRLHEDGQQVRCMVEQRAATEKAAPRAVK